MKRLLPLIAALVLAGCATPRIDKSYTAKSQDSRVQYLILHYTAGDFPGSLKTLTEGPVSAHYLVKDAPPAIYQLVDETRRAYHAGVSSWKGDTSLNASSIGIEIVNRGFVDDPANPGQRQYFDFPPEQIDAVLELTKKIVAEHHIKPERVLGHSDIAPQRKFDPGPRFPWKRFADAGLIVWPNEAVVAQRRPAFEQALPEAAWFQQRLAQHGYAVPQTGAWDEATKNVMVAFQTKYRPASFTGAADAETAALLDALTAPNAPAVAPAPAPVAAQH
jgi:N-acetylmuramoyl-L-alanine amidase